MSTHQVLFATTNPHKLNEVRAIFAGHDIEILSLDDLVSEKNITEPDETGDTFEANARMKARHYAHLTGRPTLADDSGLEVDILGGDPGVRSARFAKLDGPAITRSERDEANNKKLLWKLEEVPDNMRHGRFVCVLCLADPAGRILATSRGTIEGSIAHEPRGGNGFGYDPLLLVAGDPKGRTSAELSPEEKNERSHRAAAARGIAPQIVASLSGEPV